MPSSFIQIIKNIKQVCAAPLVKSAAPQGSALITKEPPMKRTITNLSLTLLGSLVLASCGGGPAAPQDSGSAPVTQSLPVAGAPVGSGSGTSKVYVSPNTFEVELMTFINEARTNGTVNGVPVPSDSCAAGAGRLQPVGYSGLLGHAARKHAEYNEASLDGGHIERKPEHPKFWGATPVDRARRSAAELGIPLSDSNLPGEIVGASRRDGVQATIGFLKSRGHCEIIMDPQIRWMGAGWAGDLSLPDVVYTGDDVETAMTWHRVSTYAVKMSY